MDVIIYTDGGSRGNPGPAAASFVMTDLNNRVLSAKAFFLGKATNNVAEYTALLKGLDAALGMQTRKILIRSDSELVVRQIKGQYKVKNSALADIYSRCMELLTNFDSWQIEYIPREKNHKADALVNRALDAETDIEEKVQIAANQKPLRLAILISGSGRTMINILENIDKGYLNAVIVLVISSRSNTVGVEKAKAAKLNLKIVRTRDYADIDAFSGQIARELEAAGAELAIQAGWLCLWRIPEAFKNRVMNIHPALLPSFGGQGMWGHRVHEAVLAAGCKVSGCTVHFCTNNYDEGPIIIQRCCPVKDADTPETLATRVFEEECIAYPEVIRLFAEGRLITEGKLVRIKPL